MAKMALNITRSKLSHICSSGTPESQISLRFALRLEIFNRIFSLAAILHFNLFLFFF